jgi:hypothetical protein
MFGGSFEPKNVETWGEVLRSFPVGLGVTISFVEELNALVLNVTVNLSILED